MPLFPDQSESAGGQQRLLSSLTLLALALAALLLRGSQVAHTNFFLDGDPYLHGSLVRVITETGTLPTEIPGEFPKTGLFYPTGSHTLLAALAEFGFPLTDLLRWFGPVLGVFFLFGIYLLTRRLTHSPTAALAAAFTSVLFPTLVTRFSIGLPEHFFLLASLLVILGLIAWGESQSISGLILACLGLAAGFAVHFSSYLLLPVFIVGLIIGIVPERTNWQQISRTILFGIGILLLVGGLILLGYPTVISTLKSFANTAAENAEFLPPPDLVMWLAEMTIGPLALGVVGLILAFSRRWGLPLRSLCIFGTFLLTILAFLEILPLFKLYNLLPFRAFTYLTIPLAVLIGIAIVGLQRAWGRWGLIGGLLVLLISTPFAPSGWDIDLIPAEAAALAWIEQKTSPATLVLTQPLNGREVVYLTGRTTGYDHVRDLFYREDAADLRAGILDLKRQAKAKDVIVLISHYKLGFDFNRGGWIRDGVLSDAHLDNLDKTEFFETVYKNEAVTIYRPK